MTLRVVTRSPAGLLDLDEARDQVRVEGTEENSLLISYVYAATALIEAMTQRRFLTQTLEWVRDCWGEEMVLPVAPSDGGSVAIDWIHYAAPDGTTQVLDPALYWARPHGPTLKIVPRWGVVWPWLGDAAERVVIRFTITGTYVPYHIRGAARLLVAHWYTHREAVVGVDNRDSSAPLPIGVEELVGMERWA